MRRVHQMSGAILPDPMNLRALQRYVALMVQERGFTDDINEIFILLTEELGEVATAFKNWRYYPERFDRQILGYELADLLLYLMDLANAFKQDLAQIWPEHEQKTDLRFADRKGASKPQAVFDPEMGLNKLVAHVEKKRKERNFEDTPESLMILLTEEIGEIATEIRKHWKGKNRPGSIGHELVDALTYLFRLAHVFKVDLERAVQEKEAINAKRVWEY